MGHAHVQHGAEQLLRRSDDGWTPERMAERIGCSRSAAYKALRRLVAEGVAERRGRPAEYFLRK